MIPLDCFRELLGPNCDLDEEQLREYRRQIYLLAEIIVDAASGTLGGQRSEGPPLTQEGEEVN